jgi:hypothetical protein
MKLKNWRKSNKTSEKTVEKYLTECFEKEGGKSYKWKSENNRGVPDRVCITPIGNVIFVECKSSGCMPSEIQVITFTTLMQFTNVVFKLVDTKGQVDALIEDLKLNGLWR